MRRMLLRSTVAGLMAASFLAVAPAVRTVPGISVAVNWNTGHDEK